MYSRQGIILQYVIIFEIRKSIFAKKWSPFLQFLSLLPTSFEIYRIYFKFNFRRYLPIGRSLKSCSGNFQLSAMV